MRYIQLLLIGIGIMSMISCTPKIVEEVKKPVEKPTVDTVAVVELVDTVETVVEAPPPPPPPPPMVASIKRTACFGKCPVYQVQFFADGRIVYEGKRNVDFIGWYEGRISNEKVAEILKQAKQIGYFNLSNKYPNSGPEIVDLPSTVTFIKMDEQEKTVVDRHDSPLHLQRFERYMDDMIKGIKLDKIEKPKD